MADTPTIPGIDPNLQAWIDATSGNTQESISGQADIAKIYTDAMLQQQANQQAFIKEGAAKATDLYQPYVQGGQWWGQQAKDMIQQGAPQYQQQQGFSYAPLAPQQSWSDFAKTRLDPNNLQNSPEYGLYQWQNQQQQEGIDKALAARGQFGSGSGMTKELQAKTGLEQQFTADEYGHAQNEYQQAYNQAIQQHGIGYSEAQNAYQSALNNYNQAFGVQQGQYQDKLSQELGLMNYGWLGTQGTAGAQVGAASQMGQGAIQTGQAMMGLGGQQMQGMGSAYNSLNSLYGSLANTGLGYAGLNQGQSNYNAANSTNLGLGLANLGVAGARAGYGIYNQYNPTSVDTTTDTTGGLTDPNNYYGTNF